MSSLTCKHYDEKENEDNNNGHQHGHAATREAVLHCFNFFVVVKIHEINSISIFAMQIFLSDTLYNIYNVE